MGRTDGRTERGEGLQLPISGKGVPLFGQMTPRLASHRPTDLLQRESERASLLLNRFCRGKYFNFQNYPFESATWKCCRSRNLENKQGERSTCENALRWDNIPSDFHKRENGSAPVGRSRTSERAPFSRSID